LSFRQKVESPGLSKRRFCAFDWPKRRSACLGLSSFWRNDHTLDLQAVRHILDSECRNLVSGNGTLWTATFHAALANHGLVLAPLEVHTCSGPRPEQQSAIRMNDSAHLSCITSRLGEVRNCSQLTERAPARERTRRHRPKRGPRSSPESLTYIPQRPPRTRRSNQTCLLVAPIRGVGRPTPPKRGLLQGAHPPRRGCKRELRD